MATKITKAQMFAQIKSHLTDEAEIAFIDHEMELLAKKNSYKSDKPTKTQVANAALKERIVAIMSAEPNRLFTVSEILKALGDADLTASKVTALVTQLKNDGTVVRTEDKRKAYFKIA